MRKLALMFCIFIGLNLAGVSFPSDFDGDGIGDAGIFRPDGGFWAIRNLTRIYLGTLNDLPAAGDYDGDGTDEVGVFRPTGGLWAARGITRLYFGTSGDNPLVDDYDGDGTCDIGIFRGESGLWAVRTKTRVYFGGPSDVPVAGPYQIPGRAEIAVFRPAAGLWAVRDCTRVFFGSSPDFPVPRDYTGDRRWEPGIFRDENGLWALSNQTRIYFGAIADVPQPGDFGGEGSARIGVFRPDSGLWAIRDFTRFYFGRMGDIPIGAPRFQSLEKPSLPYFGIHFEGSLSNQTALTMIRDAGARLTRKGYVSWANLEPYDTTPRNYRWTACDEELKSPGALGLTLMVTVADLPAWTSSTKSGPLKPEYLPQFAEFVNATVSRYHRPPYNVKYWELFNEPDGTSPRYGAGIGTWGYHGAEYAQMLKIVYPAIKAADPAAVVLLGGLAYDWFTDEGGNFNREFINNVIEQGGGNYFDLMNFHYYYFHHEVWDHYGKDIIGKANYLAGQLAMYGLTKPQVCTETGIWGYDDPYYLDLQACYVPQVYTRGLAAGLQTLVWYPLSSNIGTNFEGGLLYGDFSTKPGYYAFQVMTGELNGYEYQGRLGTGDENLEGYAFASPDTGKTKQVLWTNDTETPTFFQSSQIRVANKEGQSWIIHDGGPGDLDRTVNGKIYIYITFSPQYVEI